MFLNASITSVLAVFDAEARITERCRCQRFQEVGLIKLLIKEEDLLLRELSAGEQQSSDNSGLNNNTGICAADRNSTLSPKSDNS